MTLREVNGRDATCSLRHVAPARQASGGRVSCLTLLRDAGKFSRLCHAVNCLRQNVMRRRTGLLSALLLVACGGGGGSSRRTLIDSRDNYDPRSLDPALSTDVPTGRAVAYLFDGLTRFTPDARVIPSLATSWDVSPDGSVYTFHLRRGVAFTDGRPFVARQLLTMPVASIAPDSIPANFGENPVGTGPWKLVEWKHDDYLLFAANPKYWDGRPRSDSLEARIIAEPSTAVAEFESGNVDVLQVPQSEIRSWEEDVERRKLLVTTPSLELVYVAINTMRGPLRDVRVRQAINHSIDRAVLVRNLISGRGELPAGGVSPPPPPPPPPPQGVPIDHLPAGQHLPGNRVPPRIDLEALCATPT